MDKFVHMKDYKVLDLFAHQVFDETPEWVFFSFQKLLFAHKTDEKAAIYIEQNHNKTHQNRPLWIFFLVQASFKLYGIAES